LIAERQKVADMSLARRPTTVAAIVAMMTLSLMGVSSASEAERPADLKSYTTAWCGDVDTVTVDLDIHGAASAPLLRGAARGKVTRWANQQPGFQWIWVDESGWNVAGFTERACHSAARCRKRDGIAASSRCSSISNASRTRSWQESI
jgi:hypothetical protein